MFGFFNKNAEQKTVEQSDLIVDWDLNLPVEYFIRYSIINLYKNILFLCYDKVKFAGKDEKLKEDYSTVLFNNFSNGENSEGVFERVAKAMESKSVVEIVFDKINNKNFIVRTPIPEDQKQIKDGTKKNYVKFDFTDYIQTDLLKMYYTMIYYIIKSNNTNTLISNAVLVQMSKMRELVAKEDADDVIKQGKEIVQALKKGSSVLSDSGDTVKKMDLGNDNTENALKTAYSLIAGTIQMPLSFVNGELTTGLTQTGDSDNLAIERSLALYYYNIEKPCLEKLFDVKTMFIKDNTARLKVMINLLPSLEASDLLSDEEKRKIIEELK